MPSEAELFQEVLLAPRAAHFPLPGLRVIARPGWMQLIYPEFRFGGFNEVSLAVLEDSEVESVIEATLAQYRELGVRFRWSVGPDSRPLDLALRLEKRGLERGRVLGMAREIPGPDAPLEPSVTEVREVGPDEVALFSRVLAEGWGMEEGPLHRAHEWLMRDPNRRHHLFLAWHAGQPVAAASSVLFPKSLYLMGAVVLPSHRGRGVYRALVHQRMRHASRLGLTLATSQARAETSAPVLTRLGFRTLCQIESFSG